MKSEADRSREVVMDRRRAARQLGGFFTLGASLLAGFSTWDSWTVYQLNGRIAEVDRQMPSPLADPEDPKIKSLRTGLNTQRYYLDRERYSRRLRGALTLLFSGLALNAANHYSDEAESPLLSNPVDQS